MFYLRVTLPKLTFQESFTELKIHELIASCDGGERIRAVLDEITRERAIPDFDSATVPKGNFVPSDANTAVEDVPSAFSDTSMCSPSQDPSSIHFDVGDDVDESPDVRTASTATGSESSARAEMEPSAAEAPLQVATTIDDVPALVETAPSPTYNYIEEAADQANEWEWDKEAVEEDHLPSKLKEKSS